MPTSVKPQYKAIVYTRPQCPYCKIAKGRLRRRKIPFKEIIVREGQPKPSLIDGRTEYTFPQIFLAVGGCDAMDNWLPAKSVAVRKRKA
jgi:glutaredoxin